MIVKIYKHPLADRALLLSKSIMVVLPGKDGGTYYWTPEQAHEIAVRLAAWDTDRVLDESPAEPEPVPA